MRFAPLCAVAALALCLSPLACSSGSAEDDNIVTPSNEEGTGEDELRARSLTEKDDGKTVAVKEGQNVLVKLKSNPSTGYKWVVASTDKTFGYPAYDRFLKNGDAVGSSGIQRLTWKTKGGISMVGKHTVKLEYRREWEEKKAPEKTFSVTIDVQSGECPVLSPPAPGFCEKGEIKPKQDADGCTTGYECVDDCRANGCGNGKWCSACWGSFACIPNGAMC
jgi:inhibitor of cysteine peptidase